MKSVLKNKPCLAVVAACVRNPKGRILIAQRRKDDAYGGLWEFPGGKVEAGETEPKALARELKEELGVRVEIKELLNIFEDENAHKKIKVSLYEVEIIKGRPRAIECARWRWCDIQDEQSLLWAPVDKKIACFLEGMPRIEKIIEIINTEYIRYQQTPSVTKISEDSEQSAFHVLISCLISLRTKDEVTIAASERLFQKADTPEKLMLLPATSIEGLIYPAGFYRKKARLLKRISETLVKKYSGKVPDSINGLLSMKGVGRKTANLVLGLAYAIPSICVDTHVHRISNRLGLVQTRTPDETEQSLRQILPRYHWIRLNTLLVFWGRTMCKPVSPLCSHCPLTDFCKKYSVRFSR